MAARLDSAYRDTAARLPENASVRIETAADGTATLSLSALDKLEELPSLVALRAAVAARMPRVDLPELLLEMHARTGFAAEFTHASERGARAGDLPTSICAVLLAEACNTGLEPLIRLDTPALRRSRLSWVRQNYLRAETLTRANAALVAAQAAIPLARAWGGGDVASADGLRFIVPIRTIHSGPNPRYFGQERGVTYYNLISASSPAWAASSCPARELEEWGRVVKSLYLLSYIDDESYRRRILVQLNRGEGRHQLARAVFHGKRGELHQRYREGQEDQLGALGLAVNVIVLWNTLYTDAALAQLRAEGLQVRDEDVARLFLSCRTPSPAANSNRSAIRPQPAPKTRSRSLHRFSVPLLPRPHVVALTCVETLTLDSMLAGLASAFLWQQHELAISHSPLGDDVIGQMLEVTGGTPQNRDLQAASCVQMDVKRRHRQVVVVVELVCQPVRQVAPGMVVHVDQRRHAGRVQLGRLRLA